MDINTIKVQTTEAIKKLMEKPGYVNNHTFLEEYNRVTRELKTFTAQMEQAVNENRFDDAFQIDASITELKQRKEIMQPALQKKRLQNNFCDADLIAINEEILAAWREYITSAEDRMRKLICECQGLQKKMNIKQQEVEQCRDMLLARSSNKDSLKLQIKFRILDARDTYIGIIKDASTYRDI